MKSGIEATCRQELDVWIATERKRFSAIDVPRSAALPSIDRIAQIGRELCEESKRYDICARGLHFIPINFRQVSTAYAVWLNSCDVVLMSVRMLREVEAFASSLARTVMDLAFSAQTGGSQTPLSRLAASVARDGRTAEAIETLLEQGIMSFLVGHELGHLGAGHLPIVRKYGTVKKPGATTPIAAISECPSVISTTANDIAQRTLNAMEVDADLQAVQFLKNHWDVVEEKAARLSDASAVERKVSDALLGDTESKVFLSVVSLTAAIALLAFVEFKGNLLGKTHPLSVVRLTVSMRAAVNLAEPNTGKRLKLFREECTSGLLVVHHVLLKMVLDAHAQGYSSDLSTLLFPMLSLDDQVSRMLEQTGLMSAIREMTRIENEVTTLDDDFKLTARDRLLNRRWAPAHLVPWSVL